MASLISLPSNNKEPIKPKAQPEQHKAVPAVELTVQELAVKFAHHTDNMEKMKKRRLELEKELRELRSEIDREHAAQILVERKLHKGIGAGNALVVNDTVFTRDLTTENVHQHKKT